MLQVCFKTLATMKSLQLKAIAVGPHTVLAAYLFIKYFREES